MNLSLLLNITEVSFLNTELKNFKLTLSTKIRKIVFTTGKIGKLILIQPVNDTNLETIDLKLNDLNFVNFPILKNLRFLYLHRNRLTKIEIKFLF